MSSNDFIRIINASENNLKSVSLDIPKNKLVVVTGVSGSGKSSLVFDVLYTEAENRYLGSFSSHALQFMGKRKRPDVEKIENLSPAVSVGQKSIQANPRSTVGTMTEIYDYLRLLFARIGRTDIPAPQFTIDRSLFSFNTPKGACPVCKGYGVEDRLDPELLVADASKSIRDRALVITAPNGYIIYSQVTMDVMNQVCEAEGFSVDIPWKDLTPEQKKIILYGSDKIEIPFGKHTLESRMRWSGITAKPREMGYYKGILPIMETILKRERNKNILRFVRTCKCSSCNGARLNEQALSVHIHGKNIAALAALQLDELKVTLAKMEFTAQEKPVAEPILEQITKRIDTLVRLGLGYLSADRESGSLSGGESQRLRLGNQVNTGLQNVLYLFDEPSVGLHPRDTERLLEILEELRNKGNSVIVVEHEEVFIHHADWLIDIGPAAGIHGGEVLQNISTAGIADIPDPEIRKSRTLSFLTGLEKIEIPKERRRGNGEIRISGASAHNLKNIDVSFKLEALNVITGVSGAGKSSLAEDVLGNYLKKKLKQESAPLENFRSISGTENIRKIIDIDATPIGRTPRSNPATYTGMFDFIRDLFASQPLSKSRGYDKSRFSFNTQGGRCEECQGAGFQEVGMHFMGNVEILCEKCEGKRFDDETLEVTYQKKNIFDILDMYVSEACVFFADHPNILRYLNAMDELGLGYIKLGQRSTTLSGGEAQRVKLATELALPHSSKCLYILDEPTTGLHQADVSVLLSALNALVDQGNTVILIEHHAGIIAAADHVIDLGPESGKDGGYLVATGSPEEIAVCEHSYTGRFLKLYMSGLLTEVGDQRSEVGIKYPATSNQQPASGFQHPASSITFSNISTNNLKNVNISIPHKQITVLTGVSGSGKSSLAFDTIYAEGRNRFLESFSTYARTRIGMKDKPDFEEVSGLTPTLAVDQRITGPNPRSTVGTMTGIYDLYRLLFSRIGKAPSRTAPVLSSLFSFNHQHGACPACDGLGSITVCDPELLVTNPEKSLLNGAMDGTKTGKFYGDPFGQYISTLKAVGKIHSVDFSPPWRDLGVEARNLAMFGAGDEIFDVTWEYRRNKREGEHHFKGTWKGSASLVNEEYARKHADHRGSEMMGIMKQEDCSSCHGARLCSEALSFKIEGKNIAQLSALTVSQSVDFFIDPGLLSDDASSRKIASQMIEDILRRLTFIEGIGLSYLSIDRSLSTLSGGEAQRIRLGGQLGSGLTGITYVLDEPTLGLHPADVGNLMKMVSKLKEQDNTIVIVEHDRDVIRSADRIIDIGPGAGKSGGTILAEGSPEEIMKNPSSVTGEFLKPGKLPEVIKNRTLSTGISIRHAHANNLKGFDLEVPSGGIILVTGVSGSGKSSLVFDVIHASWEKSKPTGCDGIEGLNIFDNVIPVYPRSVFSASTGTPVTYTGIFDRIRDLFAKTEDAKILGFSKNHFSFLNKEGRCPHCQGNGKIRVSMDFLSDVWILCEECLGQRYSQSVLSCHYRDRNIADMLDMSVIEAVGFFHDHKIIHGSLKTLEEVGLGYLQLGQALDTLSGGESQRLMLATELMKPVKGKNLYLFEEPSIGLHFLDIRHLNALFAGLADKGHTLIIIEHDPEIIQHADRIIDLGPGGGDNGGTIVAKGTVHEIITSKESLTGKSLAYYFL
ncbi:MAG: excinuclease ABC subunit UvrA [Bacteroidetes bacterium]|nr:excinuclease ABC subunit UvrA [Bacteroidota bacterium]